ncbi:hypothetical protein NDU88_006238 [Pleurodeles waltl]|uniref:Uncharacterized protein n=1 Tax=Pleurodeles waltl TaxID=8319 RepID=A0AAV7WD09_PLEWA|nr:hypothetical protein NDU88_006238 [Pleurodeles waltl]
MEPLLQLLLPLFPRRGIPAAPFRAQEQLQRGPVPPDSPRYPPACLCVKKSQCAHPCAYGRDPIGSPILPRPPGTRTGNALASCMNAAARHVLPVTNPPKQPEYGRFDGAPDCPLQNIVGRV